MELLNAFAIVVGFFLGLPIMVAMIAIMLETFGLFFDEHPFLFSLAMTLILGAALVIWLMGVMD